MSVRPDGFDRIAPYYDALKRLVFGNAIHRSQAHFLQRLPQGCKLLIIGGGSGEVLSLLQNVNPLCRIWYVEASSKMLSLASSRVLPEAKHQVNFIHGTEESLPPDIKFDAIITNFFLDLFPAPKLSAVCLKLYASLQGTGVWLVSDFVNGQSRWQRLLLWSMYRFFDLICDIEATDLADWESLLQSTGLKEESHEFFYQNFIKSSVYVKVV